MICLDTNNSYILKWAGHVRWIRLLNNNRTRKQNRVLKKATLKTECAWTQSVLRWQKKRKFAHKNIFYTQHSNYNRQSQTKSVNKPVGRDAARSLSRELELLVSCLLCWFNTQFFLFPLHCFFCFRHCFAGAPEAAMHYLLL